MESSFLCRACPRRCGAVRDAATGQGFCAMPALPRLARAAPHFGEEPCISGTRGSGAVFFSGCGLRCVFCQNHTISAGGEGETVTVARLREIFLRLRDQGVHNINLVTPSHYTFVLAQALSGLDLGVPVVYNSSGYDSVESLRALEGLVQVYMPDLKYMDSAVAARYSAAPDYPKVAQAAIREMYRQRGAACLDEAGMLRSGVLIRHLLLPGQLGGALDVMDWVGSTFPKGSVLFSLMSQYTPMPGLEEKYPELCRAVTAEEYDGAMSYLPLAGLERGFVQERSSATVAEIPDFDGTGVHVQNEFRGKA